MLKLIAVALLIAGAGSGLAFAQDGDPGGAPSVEAQFTEIAARIPPGTVEIAVERGEMGTIGLGSLDFNAVAGRTYVVVGRCDQRCDNLDLLVTGEAGSVGMDMEPNDRPMVQFVAAESGEFHVTPRMVRCYVATCHYGVRVYAVP